MKKMNYRVFWHLLVIPMFALSCAMLLAGSGFAQQGVTRTKTLKLDIKSKQAVFSRERKLTIFEDTLIKNEEEEPISLAKLPVPCKAKVTYELRQDEDPRVLRILVQKTFIGSTTDWSASDQERGW